MRARRFRRIPALAIATLLFSLGGLSTAGAQGEAQGQDPVRFATYNASLNRGSQGELLVDLSTPNDVQAGNVAEVIQRTRPDVLLVNEFDFYQDGLAVDLFQENYLSISQGGAEAIEYPYRMAFPSNTGLLSGFDLNQNGFTATPADLGTFAYADDSWGFGQFPGQFAFAVFSMYPIVEDEVRTFQNFLWRDMPGSLLPTDPNTGDSFYSEEILDQFPLSSKNHADVPIDVDGTTVHFLVSHPTPPVFDGLEDRNGTRNHDEIRFWADYVGPGKSRGAYIYDDAGEQGGLQPGSIFVIAGDQNSDPFDGDSIPGSAQLLTEHPLVNTKVTPSSEGGVDRAAAQPGNETHLGDPANDTADFSEPPFGPGNLRADYVLASKTLQIRDAGVFWPADDDPLSRLTGTGIFGDPVPTSDHRLVWVDVTHGTFPKD
jgi:3-phytase